MGHTCTVVVPTDTAIPIERLLDLVRSPWVDALIRLERGLRLDLYPRDVAAFPVPRAWWEDPRQPIPLAYGLSTAQRRRLEGLTAG